MCGQLLNIEPLTQFQWWKRKDAITGSCLIIQRKLWYRWFRKGGTGRYESSSTVSCVVYFCELVNGLFQGQCVGNEEAHLAVVLTKAAVCVFTSLCGGRGSVQHSPAQTDVFTQNTH